MIIAVVGGRDFNYAAYMKSVLDKHNPTLIVSGGADGADTLAYHYARKRGISFHCHSVLEDEKARVGFARAAYGRNSRIVDDADMLIAFPSPNSKGTYHTIGLAKKKGIPVEVYTL